MADEKKQVTKAQWLKSVNRKKAAAKAAAKKERPAGMLDDAAILNRLGLDIGDRITLAARVSKIQLGFAKDDANRPYVRFAYTLSEDSPNSNQGRGTIVSNYHELAGKEGDGWEITEEQAFESMFFEMQALGEDTSSWSDPLSAAADAAERHTQNKTEIQIGISCYESKKDKSARLGIRVAGLLNDNSDLEDDEEEDTEEGTEEEVSYDDYVGGWVTWTDDEGSVDFLVESYDEDNFTGKDEDDNEYEAPIEQCEWAEDQRDD